MKVWIALLTLLILSSLYLFTQNADNTHSAENLVTAEQFHSEPVVPVLIPINEENQFELQVKKLIETETVSRKVKRSQVDITYDAVGEQLTEIWSVDIDKLNYVDCEDINHETGMILASSDLLELEGIGIHYESEQYADYRNFDNHTLADLSNSGDFAASQIYAHRLLGSLDTFEEGLYWAHIAIAKGSKRSILDVYEQYFNLVSKSDNPNEKQRKSAMKYRQAYDYLYQYRDGIEGYLPYEVDEEKPRVKEIYQTLFNEIHDIRASLGLPAFVNRGLPDYPYELGEKCTELSQNEINLQRIENGDEPLKF